MFFFFLGGSVCFMNTKIVAFEHGLFGLYVI